MRLAGTSNEEKSEEVSSAPTSQTSSAPADEVVNPKTDVIESACLATQDGPDNPLGNIVKVKCTRSILHQDRKCVVTLPLQLYFCISFFFDSEITHVNNHLV